MAARHPVVRFTGSGAWRLLAVSPRWARENRNGHACRVPRGCAFGRGFDSRRLHHFSSIDMGLRALRSRRLPIGSTTARFARELAAARGSCRRTAPRGARPRPRVTGVGSAPRGAAPSGVTRAGHGSSDSERGQGNVSPRVLTAGMKRRKDLVTEERSTDSPALTEAVEEHGSGQATCTAAT